MLDAYRGTIDYDGETIVEARAEVAGYLGDAPLLDVSWVAAAAGRLLSAVLVMKRRPPLVGYVMTAADSKNQGLAAALLDMSLGSMAAAGHDSADAWITEGNVPSETIFLNAGFQRD